MHGMAVTFGLLVLLAGTAKAAPCVDTALILAIDGSGSITDTEYDLQRQAFADAFDDAEVAAALVSAGNVALSFLIWGDGEFPADRADWYFVKNGEGVEPFIRAMRTKPRRTWGNTDIGAGIWHALGMLQEVCALNSIINVSGDGKATTAPKRKIVPTLPMARQRAAMRGVTINGLAISEDVPDLREYYARHVLSGLRSFVVEAHRPEDFRIAIRKKLTRELLRPVVSMLAAP